MSDVNGGYDYFLILSEHIPFPEKIAANPYQRTGYNKDIAEGPGTFFHWYRYIHTEETGNNGWYSQQNGNSRQKFHDLVQIVGNNGGEGVCQSGQDFAVHFNHLFGLLVLNDNILQQILVFLVVF